MFCAGKVLYQREYAFLPWFQVSDIENKIAALSAAGMPVDKTRRKVGCPGSDGRDSNYTH